MKNGVEWVEVEILIPWTLKVRDVEAVDYAKAEAVKLAVEGRRFGILGEGTIWVQGPRLPR